MNKYFKKVAAFAAMAILITFGSCSSEFLETVPSDAVSDVSATDTGENLMLIVNGMHRNLYVRQGGQGYSGIGGQMVIQDSYGEDLVHTAVGLNWHIDAVRWQTQANETSFTVEYPYAFYYQLIRNANTIIVEGQNAGGDQTIKNKAIGEAYAYRGFLYHQLVQLYGKRYVAGGNNSQLGVPLVLDLDLAPKARATVEEVYTQINSDLEQAYTLLNGKTRAAKSHFDGSVVNGLRARVALTQGRWAEAAQYANAARTGFPLMSNASYKAGFTTHNDEWMWASIIVADQTDYFGNFAAYMSRNYNSSTIRLAPKAMSQTLFASFPATDVRTQVVDPTGLHTSLGLPSNFVKKPYTSQKFLAVSVSDSRSDVPLMRSAEMYLIEAEALARAGNEAGSKAVFNVLEKNRNPAYAGATTTGAAYIDEILRSRRIELWGEGFRFFDLKRLNQGLDRNGSNHVPTVINNVYTVPADDLRWEYLIPRDEINANPLIEQNPT